MYVLKYCFINTHRKIGDLLLRKECNVPIHQAHNSENSRLQFRPLSVLYYYIESFWESCRFGEDATLLVFQTSDTRRKLRLIMLFDKPFKKKSVLVYWSASVPRDVTSGPQTLGKRGLKPTFVKIKSYCNLFLSFPKLSLYQNNGYTRGVPGHNPNSLNSNTINTKTFS